MDERPDTLTTWIRGPSRAPRASRIQHEIGRKMGLHAVARVLLLRRSMATKLSVPRPDRGGKIKLEKKLAPLEPPKPVAPEPKQEEAVLDPIEVVEDIDITEPSPPPVVEAKPPVVEPVLPPPPPMPVLPPPPRMPIFEPVRPPMRSLAPSLPSEYELDSIRKSSPPIIERRKQLQKYVASAVGVAWFICMLAIGETALRSILGH